MFANPAQPPDVCLDGALDSDSDGFFGCGDGTHPADPDCAYRCTPTCSPHTSCNLATEPHCGDGVCDDESYREDMPPEDENEDTPV